MICPKCGKEMEYGQIGVSAYNKGMPKIFWAPKQVFNRLIPNMLTVNTAVKEGGMQIPIGNGLTSARNTGYICKDCNCVLIDFN